MIPPNTRLLTVVCPLSLWCQVMIFGGYGETHKFLNDVWAINVRRKSVTQMFPHLDAKGANGEARVLPDGRAFHATANAPCHMFVYGGIAQQSPKSPRPEMLRIKYFDDLWRYAPAWSNSPRPGEALAGHWQLVRLHLKAWGCPRHS